MMNVLSQAMTPAATMNNHSVLPARKAEGGFTLVEIIIAMGMLLLGMTGIFALFGSALALQKEATERQDVAVALSAVMAEVREDLSRRLEGTSDSKEALNGAEFPVPGNSAYTYRVTAEPIPDDPTGRAFFCRIVVVAKSKGKEQLFDMGYRPIVPLPDNDTRIQELLGR